MIAAGPAVVGTAVIGRAHPGSSLAGVVLGAGLAMAVFALPPLILRTSSQWSPSAVMALALAGYGGTVVALAAAWGVVAGWSAVSSPAVGAGLVVATVGAVVGQIRASTRWRLPAFGAEVE